jgi:copper chaperone
MTKLKVTGMTCGHCEKDISRALSQVAGVTRGIEVSRAREEAIVDGNPDPKALIAAVQEEGYSAEVVA